MFWFLPENVSVDRDDDVDLVDPGPQRPVETAPVEHEPRVRDPGAARDPLHHRLGVRHRRDQLGVRERNGLDPPRPGVHELGDQLELGLGGQDHGLVLQPVTRADLHDGDVAAHIPEATVGYVTAEHVDALIVGAGIAGIGAACHLQDRRPGTSWAILEGRDALGGTWDLFRFPGVRSDSDMLTLGYSFRPWAGTATLADGASIRGYLRDTPASAASTPRSATATAQVALYYRFTQRAPRLSRRLLLAGLRRQLPPGYPVQTHFHPSYDPWDQGCAWSRTGTCSRRSGPGASRW